MQVLKEKVRKAILKAARAEFLKQGYDGASLRRIANKAGYTVGLIYRYYDNKSALFSAVVGTDTLSMELWENDHSAFYMLLEKKISKVRAVHLLFDSMGVQNVIEEVEGI